MGLASITGAGLSGCLASQSLESDNSNPSGTGPDGQEENDEIPPDRWPTYRVNAANTGYHPEAEAPVEGVKKDWLLGQKGGRIQAIDSDNIYFTDGGVVYSLSTTGHDRKKILDQGFFESFLTFDGDTMYVGGIGIHSSDGERTIRGGISALNFENQEYEEDWSFTPLKDQNPVREEREHHDIVYETGWVSTPITVENGRLFFAGEGYEKEHGEVGYISALDTSNGEELWSQKTSDKMYKAPSVAGNNVYFSVTRDQNFYAFDVSSGEEKWSFNPENEVSDNGAIYTTAAATKEVVYVGGKPNKMYALNARDGSVEWKFTTCRGVTPPAIDGESLYFSSRYKLYALDSETGEKEWEVEGNFGTPVVAGDTVYINGEQYIYAFKASNGEGLWRFKTRTVQEGDTIAKGASSPLVANGTVYVDTKAGDIYALKEGDKGYIKPELSSEKRCYSGAGEELDCKRQIVLVSNEDRDKEHSVTVTIKRGSEEIVSLDFNVESKAQSGNEEHKEIKLEKAGKYSVEAVGENGKKVSDTWEVNGCQRLIIEVTEKSIEIR